MKLFYVSQHDAQPKLTRISVFLRHHGRFRLLTCDRGEGKRDGPRRASVDGAQECSHSNAVARVQPEAQLIVPDAQGVRACSTSTDGDRRAPFELGKDVERATRVLRTEGLAAASACAFFPRESLSADRLPPPPSSARTARTCRPHTTCTVRAARRAPCGRRTRAGTVGGEQRCRTACLAARLPRRLRCEEMLGL